MMDSCSTMEHFSIYPIVLLTILGSHQASGLQCYGESGAPEQCEGVCGTMTALEDSTTRDGQKVRKGESERGCLPDTGRTGCIEKLFVGILTRVCFCKTNFCNGGRGARVKRDKGTKGDTPTSSEIEAFFKRPVVIGGIAGGVALIVLIVCICCCCCDCKKFCIVCC